MIHRDAYGGVNLFASACILYHAHRTMYLFYSVECTLYLLRCTLFQSPNNLSKHLLHLVANKNIACLNKRSSICVSYYLTCIT